MKQFYSYHEESLQTVGQIIIIISIIGLIFYMVWWVALRLDRVEIMTVRSKSWSREIRELEDYQVWECTTRYLSQKSCTNINGKRQCTTIRTPYQDCGWETRTRLINSWSTSGVYPVSPLWHENYTIGQGHYERRFERYSIDLSDDRELWHHIVSSEDAYNIFPVRGKCWIKLNWFNGILGIEKCTV